MAVSGIDVASYQSTTYNTTGLSFVLAKATEGTNYVNPRHADQIAHGRATHLTVGHYHFVRPGSMSLQIAYFLKNAAPKAGDILALDWEDAGVAGTDKDLFLHGLMAAAPKNRVLLYCNRDFWLNRDKTSFAGDGLWIADPDAPSGHPRIQHSWVFHQFSDAGGTDRDLGAFEDAAHLAAWTAKGVPAPASHPSYQPFPGASWFKMGLRSPIVAAMHNRLVAEGCGRYRTTSNKDVIGSGDVASYQAWQRKLGFSGASATWPPGPTSWNKLQVPKVV